MELNSIFYMYSGVLLVSGALGYRYFRLIRFLRSIPKAKIRSAPQGYVELVGKAKPDKGLPMYAPGTNRKCVWYETIYLEGDEVKQQGTQRSSTSFLVDDGTGVCRIDPLLIKIESLSSTTYRPNKGDLKQGHYRVRWIAVNDVVHVFGQFDTLHSDFGSQTKDRVRQKINNLKKDRKMLMCYDVNNDGHIDGAEWDNALKEINEEVSEHIIADQKKRKDSPQIHVLREPDNKSYPYLVSAREELSLIRLYRFYLLGLFTIFFIALAVLMNLEFFE